MINLVNSNNNKHISQLWQKYVIIKFYNQLDKFMEFEKDYNLSLNKLLGDKEKEENDLRNKQEREMQDANLNNLQLDLIVNRHILEINKFVKENEEKIINFRVTWKEIFFKTIETAFQIFIENIDPSLIIYNSENKLIQIKINKGGINFIKNNLNANEINSDTKSVKSNKSNNKIEKTNSNLNLTDDFGLFLDYKINFGLFNKNKLHFYFFKVNDHIENEMKIIFTRYIYNFSSHLNKIQKDNLFVTNETDDYLINDILKSSENFGDNIFAMVNLFNYDSTENKIFHIFDNLNSVTSKIQNEFFFDTFAKFFLKIENQCKKGNLPFEFDIFTTKHTSMPSFDILLNVFITNELEGENDLNTSKNFFNYFSPQ